MPNSLAPAMCIVQYLRFYPHEAHRCLDALPSESGYQLGREARLPAQTSHRRITDAMRAEEKKLLLSFLARGPGHTKKSFEQVRVADPGIPARIHQSIPILCF